MDFKVLFSTDNFRKIAFFTTKGDFEKVAIVSTKEELNNEELYNIALLLIDFEVVTDKFGVFDFFVTEKQIVLAKKLAD